MRIYIQGSNSGPKWHGLSVGRGEARDRGKSHKREEGRGRCGRCLIIFWKLFPVYPFSHPFILKLAFPHESLTHSHKRKPYQMWNKQQQAPPQWTGSPWPQKMIWAAGTCSLGSHGWRVTVTQLPLPLLFKESQVDFMRTNDSPHPPASWDAPHQDLRPRAGSPECSGWKRLTHQKSLLLGHADSMSRCSEATPTPKHVEGVWASVSSHS